MAIRRDPGGQLNLFDVLTLAVALGSAAVGFTASKQRLGTIVAVVIAVLAAFVGAVAVRFVTQLRFKSFIRGLNAMPTNDLWTRLKTDSVISHLIIPILLGRGESAHDLREYTLMLLMSESATKRWQGWRTLSMWFPETAATLSGTDPLKPTPQYFQQVEALRTKAS